MTEPRRSSLPASDSWQLSRRSMLKLSATAALGMAAGSCRSTQSSAPPSTSALTDPLYNSSVRALAGAIRDGTIASSEVVEAFLRRIDEVNPYLNAVFQVQHEQALAAARRADELAARGEWVGPLHGVPMTIKDSLDTEGVITTGGLVGRASYVPAQDATVVRRLRDAGAILLGKTNTPALTLAFETNNTVYGRTGNPWANDRTSGGSSGGAGAIIAAGGAPFDIGSDYGGSIRVPAHFNGIAGLKPTHGRVSRAGHIWPFGGNHDSTQVIGPLARYVGDLYPILQTIEGPDHVDPALVPMPLGDPAEVDLSQLRVAFYDYDGYREATEATRSVVRAAAAAVDGFALAVDEGRPAGVERSIEVYAPLFYADGGAMADRLRAAAGQQPLSDQHAVGLGGDELDAVFDTWYSFRQEMSGFFADHDVAICPVHAQPAPLHGELSTQDASYTMAYNLTGWPVAVVRAGASPEGLPIGVQIVAAPGREDIALAVAGLIESELGGFHPPTL